jgi:hypothetical protein
LLLPVMPFSMGIMMANIMIIIIIGIIMLNMLDHVSVVCKG